MTTWSNISCWLTGLQDVAMQPARHLDRAKTLRWRDYERQGRARHVADNLRRTEEAFARSSPLYERL